MDQTPRLNEVVQQLRETQHKLRSKIVSLHRTVEAKDREIDWLKQQLLQETQDQAKLATEVERLDEHAAHLRLTAPVGSNDWWWAREYENGGS